MYNFSIGVIIDSFRTDIPTAVQKAKAVGAQGIQVYATRGDMAPENLVGAKRKEFLDLVKSNGLVISALCGDLGGGGFMFAERNAEKIERSKRIIDLAKELETDVVTTHIGVVPEDEKEDRYKVMQEACFELSRYADSVDAHFAVETGPETSATLKKFLDSLGSTGVGVNLDPANLVMVTGDDPAGAVYNLKDYIVHTHAKDGVQYRPCDPVKVYDAFAEGGVEGLNIGELFNELPLGQGAVDWTRYLDELQACGYHGFLTVEREVSVEQWLIIRLSI